MIVGSTEVRSARVRPSRSGVDALARLSATRMLSASGRDADILWVAAVRPALSQVYFFLLLISRACRLQAAECCRGSAAL